MRIVEVADLADGDVLAKAVHGSDGDVMLEPGTVLTGQYIERLKDLRVPSVSLMQPTNVQASPSKTSYVFDKGNPNLSMTARPLWTPPDVDRLKNDDKAREEAVRKVAAFAETGLMQDKLILPMPEKKFRDRFRDVMMEIAMKREYAEEIGVMMLTDPLLFRQSLHVTCAPTL